MVAYIESLTDAHRETFPAWVERWVGVGLRTGSLSKAEWERVAAAARAEYRFAGLAEPRVVHGVTSPLAGAIAVCVAVEVAKASGAGIGPGIESGIWSSIRSGIGSGIRSGIESGTRSGVGSGVRSGVGSGVCSGIESGICSGIESGIRSGVRSGVGPGIWSGIWSSIRSGIGSGICSGIESGIWSGIESGADLLAPWTQWLHEPITRGLRSAHQNWFRQHRGGNFWCAWNAWASWFRDVAHLDLPGDPWERLETDNTLMLAGSSWWYANLCIISDRPTVLHTENVGGVNRLHCADGPAVGWPDGWGIYAWHGTNVPADLIVDGWGVDRIMREENAEVRRCAIEVMGWEKFTDAAGLAQVGASCPDPGNPGQTLALYDVPERIYDAPIRVLLCTNATAERDGSRHRFGLTVPAEIGDPVTAAAWTFGVPAAHYAGLQRAT